MADERITKCNMRGNYAIIKRAKKYKFLDSHQSCAYRNVEVIFEIYQSDINKV